MMSGRARSIASWVAQIVVAVVLGQTLFFKFTASPESVYIFETLGMEPSGRIGSGIGELVAVVLILTPRLIWLGATMGVIGGALFFHVTKLGIDVQGDGGLLFALACFVFVLGGVVLFLRRNEIPFLKFSSRR